MINKKNMEGLRKMKWDLREIKNKYLNEKGNDLSSYLNKAENLLWNIKEESDMSDELYKALSNSVAELRHLILTSLEKVEAKK